MFFEDRAIGIDVLRRSIVACQVRRRFNRLTVERTAIEPIGPDGWAVAVERGLASFDLRIPIIAVIPDFYRFIGEKMDSPSRYSSNDHGLESSLKPLPFEDSYLEICDDRTKNDRTFLSGQQFFSNKKLNDLKEIVIRKGGCFFRACAPAAAQMQAVSSKISNALYLDANDNMMRVTATIDGKIGYARIILRDAEQMRAEIETTLEYVREKFPQWEGDAAFLTGGGAFDVEAILKPVLSKTHPRMQIVNAASREKPGFELAFGAACRQLIYGKSFMRDSTFRNMAILAVLLLLGNADLMTRNAALSRLRVNAPMESHTRAEASIKSLTKLDAPLMGMIGAGESTSLVLNRFSDSISGMEDFLMDEIEIKPGRTTIKGRAGNLSLVSQAAAKIRTAIGGQATVDIASTHQIETGRIEFVMAIESVTGAEK